MIGDRYELLRRLGSGGMAEVWLAADRRLNDKHVAIKRLHGFRVGGEESAVDLERARREAFAVSRLSHPNLVAVTDFIAEQGEPFIVMEYVAGQSLDERVGPDGIAPQDAARILGQVAAALAEAHAAGIVHRDVKPANIMVTPRGDAKLADFGIARSPDDPRLTRTGSFTGTIRYLAPEILDGGEATPASDMWALGATLFEAVEGHPAFDAPTTPALIAAIAMRAAPAVSSTPRLAPLIAALLDHDPARRPSAAEVATRLPALAVERAGGYSPDAFAGRPVVAPGDPTIHRAPSGPPVLSPPTRPRVRPKRRSPRWMLVAVPIALVVAGVGVVAGIAGSNNPVASGNGALGTSPAPAGTVASASTSAPTGVGAPPPPSTTGPATSSPTSSRVAGGAVTFRGVTVQGARDLSAEPQLRSSASGEPPRLEVSDLVVGRGAAASPTSTVKLRYVGALYRDGSKFDTSWSNGSAPISFDLRQVVPGFARGVGGDGASIAAMHVGGRRIIVIPARLGYGSQATADIPANSPLVFVVDLVAVS